MENHSTLLDFPSLILSNSATLSHFNNQYSGLKSHFFTDPNASAIQPEEILYIDSAVEDYQVLIDSLTQPTEVVLLDSQQDGLIQIAESLQQYQGAKLEAIHIVSHGDIGELFLGNTSLNQDNLDNYQDILSSWSDSITADGDILLYGCNVGADLAGAEFLKTFSQYTQADILASTDLTGNENLGGDWDLEFAIGEVETETILSSENAVNYNRTLNSVFGDRLDIIFTLDGSGNIRIIDPNADASLTNFISLPRIDYEPIDLTPVNITNAFGTDAFGNFVDINDVSNFDTILPPVVSNVPFSFNFGQGNFGIIANNPSYDYDHSELNSWIFNFDASSINFNANNFDFSSAVRDGNSITFGFDSGAFNFESVTSRDKLKFTFKNYFDRNNWNNKVKLSSGLEFDATSVEFSSDSIKFKYKPETFKFDKDLFVENANLFDHKSINPENYSVSQFNASDYRALDYAFEGDELFDSEYYSANNNLIPGTNSFTHYNENGNWLGIDPNPVFDNSYYNSNNPNAATSKMTALEHYLVNWRAGLPGDPAYDSEQNTNFNSFFSSEDYFTIHDDVRVESYDSQANSPLEDLMGLAEDRITNRLLLSDDIAKIDQRITLEPNNIQAARAKLSQVGLELIGGEDGSLQIVQASAATGIYKEITQFFEDKFTEIVFTKLLGGALVFSGDFVRGSISVGNVLAETVVDGGWEYTVNNLLGTPGFYEITVSDEDFAIPPYELPEPKISVEIFKPEGIDGLEDFTAFPGETAVIPSVTGFPARDETLEAILDNGLFINENETPQDILALAVDTAGNLVPYNPKLESNVLSNDWNGRRTVNGDLNFNLQGSGVEIDRQIAIPNRVSNAVRKLQDKQRDPTHGLFSDNNRNTLRLRSGSIRGQMTLRTERELLPMFSGTSLRNLEESFKHVEGNAASIIRQLNLPGGTVIINHENGPCDFCIRGIPDILNTNQTLEVIWTPDGGSTIFRDTFIGGKVFNPTTDREQGPPFF